MSAIRKPGAGGSMHYRYPTMLHREAALSDGTRVVIRSIRLDDVAKMARFHATLSEESVRARYLHAVGLAARVDDARLSQVCQPDAESEAVLVATRPSDDGEEQILAVARLEEMNSRTAELAIMVSDTWQRRGLGTVLIGMLIELARGRGLPKLVAYSLRGNVGMQRLFGRLGFKIEDHADASAVRATLMLRVDAHRRSR